MNHLNPPIVSRFPPIPTSSTLAASLVHLVKGICDAIGERASRHYIPPLIGLVVWMRLRRMAMRFETLIARHRAGTLRPPRQGRRATAPGAAEASPTPPEPPPPEPPPQPEPRPPRHAWDGVRPSRAFGWLIRGVPEAAPYIGYLERWLAEPEVAALIRDAPQAARMLRPLCRMLGMRPDPAVLPPLPRRRRPPPAPAVLAARAAAREARAVRRAEARAERRWAEAYRASLGLPRTRILT